MGEVNMSCYNVEFLWVGLPVKMCTGNNKFFEWCC